MCIRDRYYTVSSVQEGALRIVYFLILYAVYILGYTCQGAATRGAQSTLTNDPKQRPMVSIVSGTGCSVVMAALQVLVSGYLVTKHGGMGESFFQEMVIYLIIGSGILTLLAVIGIWQKDRPEYYNICLLYTSRCV